LCFVLLECCLFGGVGAGSVGRCVMQSLEPRDVCMCH